MENTVLKLLAGAIATSGTMTVALAQGQVLPAVPATRDPISWAMMTVVAVVLFGCSWLVKTFVTRGFDALTGQTKAVMDLTVTLTDMKAQDKAQLTALANQVARLTREIDGLARACPLVNGGEPAKQNREAEDG